MTTLTLRQKQKLEALKRMELLKLLPQVKKDFEKNGTIYYSERQNAFFLATLYWVSNNEKFIEIINDFEKKHNSMVYHCQLTHTEWGDMLSLLYVSDNEEEWEMDKDDLKEGYALVRVENLDDSNLSEFGSIGIKPAMGGVVRTA